MPAPDPQTLAPRSELVPKCAKGAKRAKLVALLLLLFSACLNPMPEEFPSNGDVIVGVPGRGSDDEANELPIVPDQNAGPVDFGEGASGGSGGSGGNATPPATQPPTTGGDGDGEADAPDAGADAGTPGAAATGTDDTSSEDETDP